MTIRWTLLPVLLLLAAVPAPTAPCPDVTETLISAPDVTTWPPAPYRWRDIATNLYAEDYRAAYVYDDADVTVTYAPCIGTTFAGHLSAANLKPNFAYQIKLVGKPAGLWGDDGDDAANEMIGFKGRWWRTLPNPGNSNDADYMANHDDPDYVFEGYLLLDFFLTDPQGAAEVEFALDSSYHVLWWEHQRAQGACDSPVQWTTVSGSAADPAYDADVGPVEVGVFAEIERLCTGTTVMIPGLYNCRLLLTEETFHQSGDTQGYWASAMAYDHLGFEIVAASAAAPPAAPARLLGIHPNPCNPLANVRFELERPARVSVEVLDAGGAVIRRLIRDEIRDSGPHVAAWRGRDDHGRPVAAGTYLVRLRADGATDVRTVTLLK